MKKIISTVLTVALILSFIPGMTLTASAETLTEGDWEYTVSDGKATITGYNRIVPGTVTIPFTEVIPPTLGGYPVTAIGEHGMHAHMITKGSMVSLTIPDSVITIGDYAFDGYHALTSLTIPDSVTYIGVAAFRGLLRLESLTIPDSVITIRNGAFMNCRALTSVIIGNSVTTIEQGAFDSCLSLTSVTIPNSVTSFGPIEQLGHANFCPFYNTHENLTIRCYEGSHAHTYARDRGIKFELIGGAPPPPASPLDSASSWAREHITTAIAAGLVPQNLQSNYTQATTRAEFAALAVAVYESVKGEITGRVTFTDTNDINVQKMAYLEVVGGVGDNRFDPNGTLTREQAAVMASRLSDAIGQPFPAQASTFADNSAASSWALESIGRVQAAELMGGTGDNNFSPQTPYTREQSIITFLRFFEMVK